MDGSNLRGSVNEERPGQCAPCSPVCLWGRYPSLEMEALPGAMRFPTARQV